MNQEIRGCLEVYPGNDNWGEAMTLRFDIADVLAHYASDALPDEWDYRHSPVCNEWSADESRIDADMLTRVMPSEFVHAGNVLARYAHMLERKGYGY